MDPTAWDPNVSFQSINSPASYAPPASSSSPWQSIADALAGGISAIGDAQAAAVYATAQPAPRTAYGYAGQGYYGPTPAAGSGGLKLSPLLIVGGLVVLVLLLRR